MNKKRNKINHDYKYCNSSGDISRIAMMERMAKVGEMEIIVIK
jgi:hypothetical protein